MFKGKHLNRQLKVKAVDHLGDISSGNRTWFRSGEGMPGGHHQWPSPARRLICVYNLATSQLSYC